MAVPGEVFEEVGPDDPRAVTLFRAHRRAGAVALGLPDPEPTAMPASLAPPDGALPVVTVDGEPVAIQILYRVESPKWISVEYINGGVAPENREFSPGSVLTHVNTQQAWAEAEALGKPLRYSFGRADREYKDRWCHRVPVFQV